MPDPTREPPPTAPAAPTSPPTSKTRPFRGERPARDAQDGDFDGSAAGEEDPGAGVDTLSPKR